jgi:copper chaperone NosL
VNRAVLIVCVILGACAVQAARPSDIRLGEDACAHCRMTIVSERTAAQIVEPGADPIMFDEIGCLRNYLAGSPLGERARVFVADHRTGEWIDARTAVFTQTPVQTPMSSGLLAHADRQSRDADESAGNGTPVAAEAVLGSHTGSVRP